MLKRGRYPINFGEGVVLIDAKELAEDNITCYEVQNIKSEIDEFDRKDGTLDASTVASLKIFGIPLPTKRDEQLKKDKRAKEIAMHELEKQQKLEQAKLLEAKRVEIKREEKKQERLSKREKRKIVKEKQGKYLSMISDFETKSKILLLKESDDDLLVKSRITI